MAKRGVEKDTNREVAALSTSIDNESQHLAILYKEKDPSQAARQYSAIRIRNAPSHSPIVEKLCLHFIPSLARYPETNIPGGCCNLTELDRVITLHQSKEKERGVETLRKKKVEKEEKIKETSPSHPLHKRKAKSTFLSRAKKTKVDAATEDTFEQEDAVEINREMQVIVYDPLIKGKQPVLKDVSKTNLVPKDSAKHEGSAKNEGDLHNYIKNHVAEPMIANFQIVMERQ
ncbi:hypothetical protein E6C27_scaffold219G00580 [Cucumis melo var. makuwa]|uniref:Uncharacterized protein n=1 Tax=Cucumis melo var. makuwa TaxID=1194695 RepID=A0A5A7SQE2_CUCMM|nr:hypothetical protein E6C27_scaffold219G00580 [Cucumis melo var. makuwa]